jgi:hypothetical protein
MPVSDISTVSVESIIRTALLVYLSASTPVAIPNPAGLIGLFGAIRQKGVPAKGRKAIEDVFRVLPEAFLGFSREVLKKIESEDLPKILDASWPMNRLIQELEPLYFLRDFGPEDASAVRRGGLQGLAEDHRRQDRRQFAADHFRLPCRRPAGPAGARQGRCPGADPQGPDRWLRALAGARFHPGSVRLTSIRTTSKSGGRNSFPTRGKSCSMPPTPRSRKRSLSSRKTASSSSRQVVVTPGAQLPARQFR